MSDRPNGGNAGTGPNAKSGSSGGAKALKRYGPIVAILVIIGIIVAIAAGGGGDDDSNKVETGNTGASSNSNLPITFQEAQQQGKDIDFGPNCDTTTGRLKIPTLGAPQCVEPWDASKDNGGNTFQGVTKDAIKIAIYVGQNDPLQQALVEGAGASTSPTDYYKTAVDYIHGFEQRVELYGRKIQVVRVNATGGPDDSAAARADAIKITKEIKPFAVLGGPAQAPEFWQTVAKAKIMCIGTCSVAEGEKNINDNAPYAWPAAIAPEQADELWAELVDKQLIGKKAEFAGSDALKSKERVFGYIQAETEQGEYKARNDAFIAKIEDAGAKVAARTSYIFDPAQAQNIARTVINKMKSAGVTSILLSADPLIPANLTQEATAQDYFPEWVIGPSVYVDTTVFGRTYDQKQWAHAFGLSVLAARAPRVESESYGVYKWAMGKEPPVNAQAIPYANVAYLMIGLQLAGPDLTPDTYKEGMFRYLPAKSSATRAQISWGTKLWKNGPDYHSSDDGTMLWWDPNAKDVEDEVGNTGTGAYRYVDMGKRYLPGQWPDTPVKFFDDADTVTVFDHRPADDTPPDYPPLSK